MFQQLLSSVYIKPGTFQHPTPCQWGGTQEAGREHAQDSWPKQAKGICWDTERHAQDTNWGELAGRGSLLLGDRLGISHCVVSNCVVLACFSWGLFLLLSPFHYQHHHSIIVIMFYFVSIIVFFLSQLTRFAFSPCYFLPQWMRGVSKQLFGAQLPTGVKPHVTIQKAIHPSKQ